MRPSQKQNKFIPFSYTVIPPLELGRTSVLCTLCVCIAQWEQKTAPA